MFDRPFLTLLDSRAKIKGSRDPLGFQSIWTILGRRIIKNLTTITTSPRNFTTLLLGYYFAERILIQKNLKETEFINIFLKFEQIAAYTRYIHSLSKNLSDEEIRGILKVKRNLSEDKKVNIGIDSTSQILSNQKIYGIWGLYSVSARNSGFIEATSNRLKRDINEFIENEYLPMIVSNVEQLVNLLQKPSFVFEPYGKHSSLTNNLAKVLAPGIRNNEIKFYEKHLIKANEEDNTQTRLWEYLSKSHFKENFSYAELIDIIKQSAADNDIELNKRLTDIKVCENIIAPISCLFNYLMDADQRRVTEVTRSLETEWGGAFKNINVNRFKEILDTMKVLQSEESLQNILESAIHLNQNNYKELVKTVIHRNKLIMNERNGNEWLKINKNIIDVRFLEISGDLPLKSDLKTLWVHPYFINSFKQIGQKIYKN